MKKRNVALVTGLMAFSFTAGVLGQSAIVKITADYRTDISVIVDGKMVDLKNSKNVTIYPIMYDGTTYLPVRTIGEAVGKKVSWDEETKTVTIGKPVSTPDKSTDGLSDEVKPYLNRIEAIRLEIEETEIPGVYADKLNLFRAFTSNIGSLKKELNNLQSDFDYYHKQGQITSTVYVKQSGDVQKVLQALDDVDEMLQSKYNMRS